MRHTLKITPAMLLVASLAACDDPNLEPTAPPRIPTASSMAAAAELDAVLVSVMSDAIDRLTPAVSSEHRPTVIAQLGAAAGAVRRSDRAAARRAIAALEEALAATGHGAITDPDLAALRLDLDALHAELAEDPRGS